MDVKHAKNKDEKSQFGSKAKYGSRMRVAFILFL